MKKVEDKKIMILIFRSNKFIYAQVLDGGNIIASYSSLKLKNKDKSPKSIQAKAVGLELAKILLSKKIKKAVLVKKKYAYLGRVKALTEGLREGGLQI